MTKAMTSDYPFTSSKSAGDNSLYNTRSSYLGSPAPGTSGMLPPPPSYYSTTTQNPHHPPYQAGGHNTSGLASGLGINSPLNGTRSSFGIHDILSNMQQDMNQTQGFGNSVLNSDYAHNPTYYYGYNNSGSNGPACCSVSHSNQLFSSNNNGNNNSDSTAAIGISPPQSTTTTSVTPQVQQIDHQHNPHTATAAAAGLADHLHHNPHTLTTMYSNPPASPWKMPPGRSSEIPLSPAFSLSTIPGFQTDLHMLTTEKTGYHLHSNSGKCTWLYFFNITYLFIWFWERDWVWGKF